MVRCIWLPARIAAGGTGGALPLLAFGQFTPEYFRQDESAGGYSRSSSGATPQSFFFGAQPL